MLECRTLSLLLMFFIYGLGSCLQCRRAIDVTVEEEAHECARTCEFPAQPKTCDYIFKAEWMFSMSAECFDCPITVDDCYLDECVAADGSARPVVATNNKIPGPSIQVCQGDTVRVRLINQLVDQGGLTIHWYGMHQVGTNWMDGASMITQCPVAASSSFVYRFIANPAGTHWWHAHSGFQRDDGMFGSLIVRQAKEVEQNSNEYDVDLWENVITLLDWWSRPALTTFLMSQSPSKYMNTKEETFSMLVNGRASEIHFTDGKGIVYHTPLSTFEVQGGLAYRFRLISGVFGLCDLHVSVESHPLTIIALDGYEVMPIEVDSFVIAPGERVDFVLKATAYPASYCIYFHGTATSNCTDNGAAILVYKNQSIDEKELCTSTENSNENIPFSLSDTYALEPLDPHMRIANETVVVSLSSCISAIVSTDGRVSTDGKLTSYQIDNVIFSYPSSPLLTPSPVSFETCSPDGKILNHDTCSDDCCCTNVLKLKHGQVVDFVIINLDFVSHPMHLHGNSFRVLAMDMVDDIIHLTSDKLAKVSRTPPELAVIKDTINVPRHGYAIIRVMLDNPGYWMFHDQINGYLERGMAMVLQVGDESEIPRPPLNFPTCGPWSPD